MELKKEFGERIEIYGINYERRWNLKIVEKFARANKIFPENDIKKNLPKIYIMDAGKKINFKSSSFDFIFSQASVQYISDKAKFLEEVNRLLTKTGKAVIEIQEIKRKHPAEYQNLFEIWDNNKIVLFRNYIRRFSNIKIKKGKWGKDCSVLIMKKSENFKLNLKLVNFLDLNQINSKWWGTKAVFVVR
ncbi:methyltransferase domain-containing protein [Candidatus Pacearchaeota archaeon]|nr:methyltransferase domain-containing protein [Candidatus Pacearchaeota archaeon]MBD3283259.1 methyltransferase domain-containing protein [Candidatus Pacearchaeota archaeon]